MNKIPNPILPAFELVTICHQAMCEPEVRSLEARLLSGARSGRFYGAWELRLLWDDKKTCKKDTI